MIHLFHVCVILTTAGSGTNSQDELIRTGVAYYAAKEFSAAKAAWVAALDLVGPASSKAHVYLGSLAQEVRTVARRFFVWPVWSGTVRNHATHALTSGWLDC
jgi:hypothetical protein